MIRYPSINQMFNYGTTPVLHAQHKHGTFLHGTQTPGTSYDKQNLTTQIQTYYFTQKI